MKRVAVSVLIGPRERPDEVLLVARSPKLRFFGGYLAFPGGTLEPEDEESPVEGAAESARPYVAAVAREIFEETGVYLARTANAAAEGLARERERLLSGEMRFADLLARRGDRLDARDFTPLCKITTPPFAPVRYETWFYRCFLPEGARIEIVPGELDGGFLTRPGPALERWRRGEIAIAPPMLVLLQELERGLEGFAERVVRLAEAFDRGELHRVSFTPGILTAPLATPTKPPATHTNCYVVGEERLYVVDPAPVDPGEQERLFRLLDDLRLEGRALTGILITHYHPDHVGGVAECRRRFSIPILAHPDTARLLPQIETRPLQHGEELDLGRSPDGRPGWRLRAFHVPGHAPGHLAFQENRYRALILGDLISTLSSILIDPSDGHLRTYLDSLQFLATVATGTVYPGHGAPAREGRKAIESQIRHREERERQLVAALAAEPQTVDALVEKVYRGLDERMLPLARRSLLSGLIKLEEEGRVEETPAGYRLVGG